MINHTVSGLDTVRYFRRIVRDTLWYADTSNVVRVEVIPWPVPQITADTAICFGERVTLTASGGESYHWNNGESGASLTVSPETDTKYTVVITNGGQCAVDTFVTVVVHPLPAVSLGADTAVCNGESLLLDAGAFFSWQWNTGEVLQTLTVDTTGHYAVTVTDDNGCENSDTVYVEFRTCTGVNMYDPAVIRVFPNPTHGIIRLQGVLAAGVETITLLTVSGRIIRQLQPNADIVTFDLTDQPAGIYMIRMTDQEGRQVVKRISRR